VLTGFPNYPTGIIPDDYRGKLLLRETHKNVEVIRTYIYASPPKNLLRRLLGALSFTISSSITGRLLKPRKYDAVLTISPLLPEGIAAYLTSKFHKAPLVLSIQDLYPETTVALNVFSNNTMTNLANRLVQFLYEKAAGIAVISSGFKQNLVQRGIPFENIDIIPNWVDIDFFSPENTNHDIKKQYGLGNKFIVLFLGTIGLAQGCDVIIDSAHILKAYNDIGFVFVGEGADKPRLQSRCTELGLTNVHFIPAQPRENVPAFLHAADICLVCLKDRQLFHITIPCKTYEYMASGRPVIMAVAGEAAEIVQSAQCGICVEPENPEQLAEAVIELYKNPDNRLLYGENGRRYAQQNFSRFILTRKMEKMINYHCNNKKVL
jgi:glycosyltransferase involved in cell wall biosynthesis